MRGKLFNIALCLVVLGAAALTLRQTPAPAAALPIAARAVQPTASPHPVDAYRAARAQENSRIEALLSLLADEGLDERTRAQAQSLALSAAQRQETALAVEGALAGLGYARAVCVCDAGGVQIFVDRALSERDAALIFRTVQEATGLGAECIRVVVC